MPVLPADAVLTGAFTAGWTISQLHGPLLDRSPQATAPLPSVEELGRASAIDLAVADLRAALSGPLAGTIAPIADETRLSLAGLEAAAASGDRAAIRTAVEGLHVSVLTRLAVAGARLASAYSAGRSLSDTCWAFDTAETFRDQFSRYRLSDIQGWLSDIGAGLPAGAVGAVSQSLDHWAAWAEVHNPLNWVEDGPAVQAAARAQAEHWHALLTGMRDPASLVSPQAYVEAAQAALRRAQTVLRGVVRHYWVYLLIAVLAIVAVVVIAVVFADGTAKVWGAVLPVVVGLGLTGAGVRRVAGQLANDAEKPLLGLANSDAMSWACTWLPVVKSTAGQKRRLRKRGVAPPSGSTIHARRAARTPASLLVPPPPVVVDAQPR
jgi:hypothetical protein